MKIDEGILSECKKIALDNKKTFTQLVTDILFAYLKEYNKEENNGK